MPGRLIMDPPGAKAMQDLKKDRSQAQLESAPGKQDAPSLNGEADHGSEGPVSNGVSAPSAALATTNGDATAAQMALTGADDPPELDQSWRASDANKSMGVLLERLAQQCFSDLNETLTKMSEVPMQSQAANANGGVPHTSDTSEASLTKKRTFMEFANSQRDRFIKTLVLSDWSRNGEEMAKLVDIKVWQEKQSDAQNSAIWFIGQTKRDLSASKIPNPNIEGALELLATGKSSRSPDMGYIPPKRLSAKQLLKTLQDMNVILATRLNLHEELSTHFSNYLIKNGRATFRVPGEFEVDLSVADEDSSSPFYFIDARFLFSPAADSLSEQMRAELEMRTNMALATKGLQGCYDFLHSFILSYKIQVLADQTSELIRGKWFDCLRIERKRRVLVLHYFAGLKNTKSWVEIGVSTGKQRGVVTRRPPVAKLTANWLRKNGTDIQREPIDIDTEMLNVEVILIRVIAKHASWRLGQIRDGLLDIGAATSKLEIRLKTSSSAPEDCSLVLSLPDKQNPLTIRIEPITGRLSISPSTHTTARMEWSLNNGSTQDVVRSLAKLICGCVQERVGKSAELAGWLVCNIGRQPNLQALLGAQAWDRFTAFTCNEGWGEEWALVATLGLDGAKWMIARTKTVLDEKSQVRSRFIATVELIPVVEAFGAAPAISRTSLLRIEKLAAAEVSYSVLALQLRSLDVKHRYVRLGFDDGGDEKPRTPTSTILEISSSAILEGLPDRGKNLKAIGLVRVSHLGIEIGHDSNGLLRAKHEIRLIVEAGSLRHLQRRLVQTRDPDIAMNEAGALAIRVSTPFGQPFLNQLEMRLQSCQRLDDYVKSAESHGFTVSSVSLSRFAFTYSVSPELSASVTLNANGSLPERLELTPVNGPHERIKDMLEQGIRGQRGWPSRIPYLCRQLRDSLPLMQSFDKLVKIHSKDSTLQISVETPTWYKLEYQPSLPPRTFDVQVQIKNIDGTQTTFWTIGLANQPPNGSKDADQFEAAWKTLCALGDDRTERGWFGSGNSIISKLAAIGDAIGNLDEMMRKLEGTAEAEPKKEDSPGVQRIKTESQADVKPHMPDVKAPKGPQSALQGPHGKQNQQVAPSQKPQSASSQQSTARPKQYSAFTGSQQQPNKAPQVQRPAATAQMQRSGSGPGQPRPAAPMAAQMQRSASTMNGQQRPMTSGPLSRQQGSGKSKQDVIELD